jgi:hypothetical protein
MSGLSRTPGKRVWANTHRGFESRSLRHNYFCFLCRLCLVTKGGFFLVLLDPYLYTTHPQTIHRLVHTLELLRNRRGRRSDRFGLRVSLQNFAVFVGFAAVLLAHQPIPPYESEAAYLKISSKTRQGLQK